MAARLKGSAYERLRVMRSARRHAAAAANARSEAQSRRQASAPFVLAAGPTPTHRAAEATTGSHTKPSYERVPSTPMLERARTISHTDTDTHIVPLTRAGQRGGGGASPSRPRARPQAPFRIACAATTGPGRPRLQKVQVLAGSFLLPLYREARDARLVLEQVPKDLLGVDGSGRLLPCAGRGREDRGGGGGGRAGRKGGTVTNHGREQVGAGGR